MIVQLPHSMWMPGDKPLLNFFKRCNSFPRAIGELLIQTVEHVDQLVAYRKRFLLLRLPHWWLCCCCCSCCCSCCPCSCCCCWCCCCCCCCGSYRINDVLVKIGEGNASDRKPCLIRAHGAYPYYTGIVYYSMPGSFRHCFHFPNRNDDIHYIRSQPCIEFFSDRNVMTTGMPWHQERILPTRMSR